MAVRVWIMARHALMLPGVLVALFLVGCGGGAGTSGGGGIETPQVIPALTAIAPSSTTAGTLAVSLVLFGSNFENGATVQWNGAALSSSRVSATEMTATIPASYIVAIGSAKVTVTNPIPGGGSVRPRRLGRAGPLPEKLTRRPWPQRMGVGWAAEASCIPSQSLARVNARHRTPTPKTSCFTHLFLNRAALLVPVVCPKEQYSA
jgi:hypothetical protein